MRRRLRTGSVAAFMALALVPTAADAAVSAVSQNAAEGVPLSANTTVATFTDGIAPLCAPAANYAATVNWGDGTPAAPATIAAPGISGLTCVYAVTAGHTFAEESSSPLSLSVSVTGGGATGTGTASSSVSDAPLRGTAATFSGAAGASLTAVVAGIGDANPGATASDFAVRITWGDGTAPSAGSVAPATTPGTFTVAGSHTYAHEGSFPVTVQVDDVGGASTTISSSATISPASSGGGGGAGALTITQISVVRAAILTLRIGCPAGEPSCRGRVTASLPRGSGALTLGNPFFVIPGGGSAKLDIRPTGSVLSAAAGLGATRATITATWVDPSNGHSGTTAASAAVRFARSGASAAGRGRRRVRY